MSESGTLGHHFADAALRERALTHRSAAHANNERLEFLGDALLNLLVAELIFERHPRASEGEMTRLRAALVNGNALAGMARAQQLGDLLHLGPGELKSGGHRRDSILADAFEALVAAVYLDGGWEAGGRERHLMALPAYDQCIKASHAFNLLDARGAISVAERTNYIGRVRNLARLTAEGYLKQREKMGFPLMGKFKK